MSFLTSTHNLRLYGYSDMGSQPILALLTHKAGNLLVKRGKAVEGVDKDGVTPCFMMLKPEMAKGARRAAVLMDVEEDATIAFSEKEVMAIAGRVFCCGASRTARMNDRQRQKRIERGLRAEDLVERASRKLDDWLNVGGIRDVLRTIDAI